MPFPEIGGIPVASTMNCSVLDSLEPLQTEDGDVPKPFFHIGLKDQDLFDMIRIQHRACLANDFRHVYKYGPSYEERTFVCPDRTFSLTVESSGIVWAAVHGTHWICVVTRTGDLDLPRAHDYLRHYTVKSLLPDFRISVISELEDFASPDSQLSEPKPFGVVSVKLGSDRVHEESDHESSSVKYDVPAAIKFLQEEMKGSTVDETIKSAISAFQNLFQNKKFKAEEIEVSVMDPDYCYYPVENLSYTDTSVKHLVMSDIEDYLAAINKPISRNSSSVGKNMGSPKITEPFADLKRKLSTTSIPDIGGYSRNKKKKEEEHMTAVDPKSRAVGGTETPASQYTMSGGGILEFQALSPPPYMVF